MPGGDQSGDRSPFGRALREAMKAKGWTQDRLAVALDYSQGQVSAWVTGLRDPEPAVVFQIEKVMRLPKGHLSRSLGYIPVELEGATRCDVREAIDADPLLDKDAKKAMHTFYAATIR